MKSKRIWVSLPPEVKQALQTFAVMHDVTPSFVVARAVTETCAEVPTKDHVDYTPGDTGGIQITVSDTMNGLLHLWEKETGLTKSKLIVYALRKTIMERDEI